MGARGECRPVRPRRTAPHGGVPDPELPGPAHEPGEARLLGGASPPGRDHSAAAADRAGTAEGRGPTGRTDAPPGAGAAPGEPGLRGVPRAVRFLRAGL